ncbi:MAG: class I SAM-dependent methyltransferase [Promethearchaeota archaeon]
MNREEWQKSKGEEILREFGIKEDQKILDFGCGSGVYSIIASRIVGNTGKIYALDCEEAPLEELSSKITTQNISNIEIIKTSKKISIPLKSDSLDVVLMYDVYHLLEKDDRIQLLDEIHRVLKSNNGILSYFATHIGSYGIQLNKVQEQIKKAGFEFIEQFKRPMFHWTWIEQGMIFKYKKIGKK